MVSNLQGWKKGGRQDEAGGGSKQERKTRHEAVIDVWKWCNGKPTNKKQRKQKPSLYAASARPRLCSGATRRRWARTATSELASAKSAGMDGCLRWQIVGASRYCRRAKRKNGSMQIIIKRGGGSVTVLTKLRVGLEV